MGQRVTRSDPEELHFWLDNLMFQFRIQILSSQFLYPKTFEHSCRQQLKTQGEGEVLDTVGRRKICPLVVPLQHCVASMRDCFEMAGAQGECNTPQQFIPGAPRERKLS